MSESKHYKSQAQKRAGPKIIERLDKLRSRGVLVGGDPDSPRKILQPVAHRPGVLDRFLQERGR